MRSRLVWVVVLTLVAGTTTAAPAASEPRAAAGTINVKATFGVLSDSVQCPADTPAGADCRARTGQSLVQGLGSVSEDYIWSFTVGPPACPANLAKPLATTGRLKVAAKGEITFRLDAGARCVDVEPVRNEPQEFTITGGTGPFVAASGEGTIERSLAGGAGTETWTGTLDVPDLTFDLTAPTFRGAVPKTVRAAKGAKTARVTFKVTAVDAVDGAVPTACQPKSGSRFKVGKTTVRCSAMDSSANTAKKSFTVTVKRR